MTWDGTCAPGDLGVVRTSCLSLHLQCLGYAASGPCKHKLNYCAASQIFCGKNGRNATYLAPSGGNIKLTAASLMCDSLTLTADGGKGAAGQVRSKLIQEDPFQLALSPLWVATAWDLMAPP